MRDFYIKVLFKLFQKFVGEAQGFNLEVKNV